MSVSLPAWAVLPLHLAPVCRGVVLAIFCGLLLRSRVHCPPWLCTVAQVLAPVEVAGSWYVPKSDRPVPWDGCVRHFLRRAGCRRAGPWGASHWATRRGWRCAWSA